jgi:SAM-dependent methyltransferase
MAQLEFNEGLAAQMEIIYSRRDILRRRALVHEALGAVPGDRVLDAGCGPGFYVAETLDRVGPEGSVVGVDASAPMLALAAKRCEGHDNVGFEEGDVTALPVADADFDRALSVQVLEYVADIPAALAEIFRVLRPGGRVLIWDVDWATVSWHSQDPARMGRLLEAWDRHLTHVSLPQTLAPKLRASGFEDVRGEGHAFATTELDPESYGGALAELIVQYAVEQGGMDEEDAKAWQAEQQELGRQGQFFFSCTQFCFTGVKPA